MKLPCAVVRDLLPLFAEKMTEPETKSLIEEHLNECPECQKQYSEIETEVTTAIDTTAPLRTLKKELRKRRRYAALIAGLLVLVFAVTCLYHTTSLKPLRWQDGLITVKGTETVTPEDYVDRQYCNIGVRESIPSLEYSGTALILEMDSRITGVETEVAEEDGIVTAIIQGFGLSSAFNREASPQTGEMVIFPAPDRLIYGYDDSQMLLWGEELNGGIQVLPRLALAYYLIIAVILAVLSGFLWFVCRNKQRSWIVRQIFIAPLSYAIAHLLIMGSRTSSFSITRDFCYILLTAYVLYALLSLLWQVWLMKRKAA